MIHGIHPIIHGIDPIIEHVNPTGSGIYSPAVGNQPLTPPSHVPKLRAIATNRPVGR